MEGLEVFFQPLGSSLFDNLRKETLGNLISVHNEHRFPETEGAKIAIVGVLEDRNSSNNLGCANGPDVIRKYLYQLTEFDEEIGLIDLGNISPGKTTNDTYYAVKTVCSELIKAGILPLN